jgi:hypothetical protein
VTVSLHSGQNGVTATSPVHFDVVFTELVTGFTKADVDLSSSTATTGTVTEQDDPGYSSDGMHYNVEVVVSSDGAVTLSIPRTPQSTPRTTPILRRIAPP